MKPFIFYVVLTATQLPIARKWARRLGARVTRAAIRAGIRICGSEAGAGGPASFALLQPLRMTTSAKRYARSAEEFQAGAFRRSTRRARYVHHLMAVFIYKPWVHERDLAGWGFEQKAWSIDFLELMRSLPQRRWLLEQAAPQGLRGEG